MGNLALEAPGLEVATFIRNGERKQLSGPMGPKRQMQLLAVIERKKNLQ